MKKLWLSLILLFSLALALSGCAYKEPTTVTVWHYYAGPLKNVFEEAVASFNTSAGQKSGVIMEAVQCADIDDLAERVVAASKKQVGSDPLPDLIFAYSSTALELDRMGLLENFDSYFTEEELNRYIPAYIEEGRIGAENRLLSFPVAKSTELLYVENVAFSKFLADTSADPALLATYEGISELSELYYRWSDSLTPETANDGKAFFGIDATPNFISVCARQLSGVAPVTAERGEASFTLDKATAKKLWDFYYPAIVTGRFAEIGWYRADDMKAGELIVYQGSSGGAVYFPTEIALEEGAYETELACCPQPVFQGGERVTIQQGAGLCMLSTTQERQKAAVRFIKWFTAPEQNIAYALSAGYSPVQKAEYTDALLDAELKTLWASENRQSQSIARVLEQASRQMNEYALTVDKEYPGSYEMRNYLGTSMSEAAGKARAAYLAALAGGMEVADAREAYISSAAFEGWYAGLIKKFDELTQP